jgi:hypothetical protein
MQITSRDLQIIAFVSRFGQVTLKHIEAHFFAGHRSNTSVKVVLRRLVSQKLLVRVERRTVGGARGGSGQYVYQLGYAGWRMSDTKDAYSQARTVNYHSLAIAEVFTSIHRAESDAVQIVRYEVDEESSIKINYIPINPDMYLELRLGAVERRVWVEVDLGTERPKQLKDKLIRYHDAWLNAPDKWNPFPMVVWVLPDEKRKAELESLIAQQPKESQPMYRTATFEDVAEVVTS